MLANLVAPRDELRRLLARSGVDRARRSRRSPRQQAQLFVGLDRTFTAFASVARPYIQETIVKSAPTEATAIDVLPVLRPFFHHSQQFFAAFEPGAEALGRTSPEIAAALRAGHPGAEREPGANAQLEPTAQALLDFQSAPGVIPGLELLTSTNQILDPSLRFITPAQATCNYLTLLFRNAASIGDQGNELGTWTRVSPLDAPNGSVSGAAGSNNEGTPPPPPRTGTARTISTTTPTRTPPRPASPPPAWRATSSTPAG